MTDFRYAAYGPKGEEFHGTLSAASPAEAEKRIAAMGLVAYSLSRGGVFRAGAFRFGEPAFFGRGIPRGAVAAWTADLAALLEASVPLHDALRTTATAVDGRALREAVDGVAAAVSDGKSLADALAGAGDAFGPEYVSVARAGEAAGGLGTAMRELADLVERRERFRANVASALIYPGILVATGLASTATVVGLLAPAIEPVFADAHRPMPLGLRFAVAVTDNWREGAALAGAVATLSLSLVLSARSDPPLRAKLDGWKLRTPFAGPLIAKLEAAKFARTAGSLVSAGVPALQALSLARDLLGNAAMAAEVHAAVERTRDGEPIARAFARVRSFPPFLGRMLAIGEDARRLGPTMTRAAGVLERQAADATERALAILTPALTIVIAAMVGGLIFLTMTSILDLNDLATR